MKMSELHEWGRIVKDVNTTPDVGIDEIPRQAKKFGNTVDKDGRPPTLSKKVKGKSTNVLFNLGLTEGIVLKFERDKHLDVLHIMDTKEKHRVEVRGKPGYERGNHDNNDKLHQVLDALGKAANFAELMNGETVSINPNHPHGERAIRTARDVLQTEAILKKKFTAMELALMEGGHSIEDETPRNKNAIIFNLDLFEEKADAKTRKNYNDFAKFCVDTLGIEKFPKITMTSAALDRTFGYFDVEEQSITVSYNRRHQMDTMRTLAHELVHCKQREEKEELDGSDGSPDENEANGMAGVLLRRWADKNPHLFSESVQIIDEAWSEKYKRSINCNNPKGFSQKAHCAGRKKNEASRPRMNPADIAADTIASSQPLSQEELQSLVNDYRAKPPRAVANLLNRFDVDKVINIAMMIGAPHLSFLQRFLIRQGINFSKRTMRQALAQVESIEENFADGKVKGKSRPGRVKRAGASCNGSVTELRRKAKNASGERAKMYHWCANMKSGRNK